MKKSIIIAIMSIIANFAIAQHKNTSTDVLNYKEKDGFIIIELTINGTNADFLLDLAGKTAILPEYVEKLGITEFKEFEPNNSDFRFLYKKVEVDKIAVVNSVAFGNNAFSNGLDVPVIPDKENKIRKLGVAGIVSGTIFRNCVLTIDAKRKKITTSVPYRPSYISLVNRSNMIINPGSAVELPVDINGKTTNFLFDTGHKGLIIYPNSTSSVDSFRFVKVNIISPSVTEDSDVQEPSIGLDLLQHGIVSIDYLHSKVYFQSYSDTKVVDENQQIVLKRLEPGVLNQITKNEFIEYIYDYKSEKDFISKYDKPVVIDFWATWCGPCMRLLPEMEKMAEKYKDQVVFLKVNADVEKELCARFNITALPTLFFIPKGGRPITNVGAQAEKYEEIIKTQLLEN